MSGNELGHLEHVDLAPAPEYYSQSGVGVDHSPVDSVLKFVSLNVVPELLRDLGSWDRLATDHCCQSSTYRHRPHKSRIRFPFGFLFLLGLFLYGFLLGFLLSLFLGGFFLSFLFGFLLSLFLGCSFLSFFLYGFPPGRFPFCRLLLGFLLGPFLSRRHPSLLWIRYRW